MSTQWKNMTNNGEPQEKKTVALCKFSVIFVLGVIIVGFSCQVLIGACKPSWFAFPVNLILLVSQVYLVYICRVKWSKTVFWDWFSGRSFTTMILLLLISSVLVMGLIPQHPGSGKNMLSVLGFRQVHTSWWFIIILFLLTLHLVAVIFRRVNRLNFRTILFTLLHGGFLLALWGGFFGSADDHTYKMLIGKNETVNIAYLDKNTAVKLPFDLQLHDCEVEYYDSGEPKQYSARIQVMKGEETGTGEIRVNHPYRYGMFEFYLQDMKISPDAQNKYCIIQLVKQPWRMVISCGILLMIAGSVLLFFTGSRIKHSEKEVQHDKLG